MRNTILDRIARLLILGAISTGMAGTLSAVDLHGPEDVKSNSNLKADVWHLKSGSYSAWNTADVSVSADILDGGLGIGANVLLNVNCSDDKSTELVGLAGLAVRDDVRLSDYGVLTISAEKGGQGLFIQSGDFIATSGLIVARAKGYEHGDDVSTCSAGLFLAGEDGNGSFVQEGGTVIAWGENGGDGIVIAQGDYTLQGGELDVKGKDKTHVPGSDGIRIVVQDGVITYYGFGTDYYGCGLVLKDGDFIQNAGIAHLSGSNGGCGIVIENGDFRQNGGELNLYTRDGALAAMTVDGDALFGEKSTVVLNVEMGDNPGFGTILVAGDVTIEKGAAVDIALGGNTTLLDKDALITGTFLKMEKAYDDFFSPADTGTISGEFLAEGTETLTLTYRLDKSVDDKQYDVTLSRKAWASEVMSGNNAQVAAAMERALPNLNGSRYESLQKAYGNMDLAASGKEIDAVARSLTPWQATQFARISLQQMDTVQRDMSENLDQLRIGGKIFRDLCEPCEPCEPTDVCGTKGGKRHLWFAGHGNFAHYGAKSRSFSALDVDSYGMNVGLAQRVAKLGRNTVAGIAFNYTNGNVDGSLSDTDFDYYGFLGSLKTDLRRVKGWAELSFGYSRARYDQARYDFTGCRHSSNVDHDVVRLGLNLGRDFVRRKGSRWTPIVGLEYTMVHQGGYSENGTLPGLDLKVGGDSMNSLRLRLGLEGAVKRRNLELSAHGYLRYEMLDRYPILETRFAEAPMIRFAVRGQDVDRCSGVTGLKLRWHVDTLTYLALMYDLTVGDKSTEHGVHIGLSRSW